MALPQVLATGSWLQAAIFATPLANFNGNLYAAFIDGVTRYPSIAKSTDGGQTWTTAVIRASATTDDAHNCNSIGIDRSGYIHASFNMHSNPLLYSRSNSAENISAFSAIDTMTGVDETNVTYPQFFNSPVTGKLYCLYRTGASDLGATIINVYDETSQTWRRLGGVSRIIDGGATAGTGLFRGPYPNNITFDAADDIVLTWVWRTNTPDVVNNGFFYARFDARIKKWIRLNGVPYNMPVVVAAVGGQVWAQVAGQLPDYPSKSRLINTGTTVIDPDGDPHILALMDDDNGKSQIWHTRIMGTVVETTQITNLNITPVNPLLPDLSRSLIFIDQANSRLGVLYTDGGTSSAINFVAPPGNTFVMFSTDGYMGAEWSAPVQHTVSPKCGEYNLDYGAMAAGTLRFYGQSVETASGPLYVFSLVDLLAA